MKKCMALLLTLALLSSLCACGKSYKLSDVPKELSLDVSALSEDAEHLMPIDDATPLIAAIPEQGLYVYCTDPQIVSGVLFKFDGVIQYYSWSFTPQIADPEVYLSDYNGDGRTDIAFTYCDTASSIKHNENLHVLLRNDTGFTDCVYGWDSAGVDASTGMVVDDNGDGTFTAHLNGHDATAALDASGFGELLGVYANDVQDFTLGDTITLTVQPGLVFKDRSLPVYDLFTYTATMRLTGDFLSPTDAIIRASNLVP